MEVPPGAEQLAAARTEVDRACNLLIASTAEALHDCPNALVSAMAALREFHSHCQEVPAHAGTIALARSLQKELARARHLLGNLDAFYRGWERILGAMSGGYTSDGAPANVARPGRLYCRG